MIYENISLKKFFPSMPTGEKEPVFTSYCISNSKEIDLNRRHPVVLVLPGGGYMGTSEREGEPIALRLLAGGISSFVLHYNVCPVRYPAQLLQACAAIAYIRRNADKYMIDPDRITVLGFSAGGHLCGSVGTLWNQDFVAKTLGTDENECRPNAMVPCYGVLLEGEYGVHSCMVNLIGADKTKEEYDFQSLEKHIGAHTPPAFIWHTVADTVVPVENSLIFANVLQQNGISFEMHIYPTGQHGLSTADTLSCGEKDTGMQQPEVTGWLNHCIDWIKRGYK